MKVRSFASILALSTILFYACSAIVVSIAAASIHERSEHFVSSSGHGMKMIKQSHEEEQQLENLKALPANIAVSETRTKTMTNFDGKTEMHRIKEEKVKDTISGQTLSKISQDLIQKSGFGDSKPETVLKTEIDIPSKGIHKVSVNMKKPEKQMADHIDVGAEKRAEEYYLPHESVQYSPGDMAEYVRRTGDDEGVALAVQELVRERLMSRADAAAYLEDVKNNLEFMQQQFVKNRERNAGGQTRHQSLYLQQNHYENSAVRNKRLRAASAPSQQPQPNAAKAKQGSTGTPSSSNHPTSSLGKKQSGTSDSESSSENWNSGIQGRTITESDEINYEEFLERLRIADFLYEEYSLEEVIYQLAKEMFARSLSRSNGDAEESLQRFSTFLQEETAEGRISKDLETKILDVVMAAFMDAVGGHPSKQPKGAPASTVAEKERNTNAGQPLTEKVKNVEEISQKSENRAGKKNAKTRGKSSGGQVKV